jgi:hypothetical protein
VSSFCARGKYFWVGEWARTAPEHGPCRAAIWSLVSPWKLALSARLKKKLVFAYTSLAVARIRTMSCQTKASTTSPSSSWRVQNKVLRRCGSQRSVKVGPGFLGRSFQAPSSSRFKAWCHRGTSQVGPNPSFNRRPTTAGSVSLACGQGGIITAQAYAACLRGRR